MVNYCPGCGAKLEKDFKYCPACGISLGDLKSVEIVEEKTLQPVDNINMIVCENCGEENIESNSVCDGCGAKLSGDKIIKAVKQGTVQKATVNAKSKIIDKKKKQSENVSSTKTEDKVLDSTKMIITIGIIAAGIILILAASGVFSSGTVTTQTNINNQSTGVDLSNLNEINRLQTIVDSIPDDYVSLLQLAHLLNDSGLFPKAIESYKKYLDKHPEDADARIDMGVCYYNLKDFDSAIKEMTAAIKYKPDHQIGHLNLGIVHLSAGNLEKSKEWLQKAININPNNEVGKRAQELLHSH